MRCSWGLCPDTSEEGVRVHPKDRTRDKKRGPWKSPGAGRSPLEIRGESVQRAGTTGLTTGRHEEDQSGDAKERSPGSDQA